MSINKFSLFILFLFFILLCKSPEPEGHFKVWATIIFSRGRCHLLLGMKQGYPFYSPYECRLGYHQSKAWPVEQKALPPQLYVASVTTGIRTHTLLIKEQSLNPVPLTARPWHATTWLSSIRTICLVLWLWHSAIFLVQQIILWRPMLCFMVFRPDILPTSLKFLIFLPLEKSDKLWLNNLKWPFNPLPYMYVHVDQALNATTFSYCFHEQISYLVL